MNSLISFFFGSGGCDPIICLVLIQDVLFRFYERMFIEGTSLCTVID